MFAYVFVSHVYLVSRQCCNVHNTHCFCYYLFLLPPPLSDIVSVCDNLCSCILFPRVKLEREKSWSWAMAYLFFLIQIKPLYQLGSEVIWARAPHTVEQISFTPCKSLNLSSPPSHRSPQLAESSHGNYAYTGEQLLYKIRCGHLRLWHL